MKSNVIRKAAVATAVALCVLFGSASAKAQMDTIRISNIFSTHVMFPTDLVYVDVSNRSVVSLKVVEQNKNMFGIKAREAFTTPTSVSALESNGRMHTWIVVYEEYPKELVIDLRVEKPKAAPRIQNAAAGMDVQGEDTAMKGKKKAEAGKAASGGVASTWKGGDAPLLQDVLQYKRELFHLGTRDYGIEVACENIFSYSDITYIVLSLKNRSGISYNISDATFVIENRKTTKRKAAVEKSLFPQSRYGTLSTPPGGMSRMAYSLDKISLSRDQVLRVYFYEDGGQRELVMTLGMKDINKAKQPRL